MEENKKTGSDEELKLLLASVLARQNAAQQPVEEEDFDWMGMLSKLMKKWKFIAMVSFAFAVLGVGVALIQKRAYTVTATLAPEVKGKSGGGSLGGIASMLGVGGVDLTNTTDALNISLFPEISSSTPFIVGLFDVVVTPHVSKKDLKEGAQPPVPVKLYDYLTRDQGFSLGKLIAMLLPGDEEEDDGVVRINDLTKTQADVVKALDENIAVDVDKKTGVTTVSVTVDDPRIATQLADTVCARLQDHVIDYRTKKAKQDLDFYTKMSEEAREKMVKAQSVYANNVDKNRGVILQSMNTETARLLSEAQMAQQVYQQMEAQKNQALTQYQELKPVYAVIQPATFPQLPNRSRKTTVLIFAFMGVVLSGGWVLYGKELLEQFKKGVDTAKEQE